MLNAALQKHRLKSTRCLPRIKSSKLIIACEGSEGSIKFFRHGSVYPEVAVQLSCALVTTRYLVILYCFLICFYFRTCVDISSRCCPCVRVCRRPHSAPAGTGPSGLHLPASVPDVHGGAGVLIGGGGGGRGRGNGNPPRPMERGYQAESSAQVRVGKVLDMVFCALRIWSCNACMLLARPYELP